MINYRFRIAKFVTIVFSLSVSPSSYGWPELPFCPSGGPPGWMNYFDYKRDKNNWRNHFQNQNYQGYYSTPAERYRSFQNSPGNFSAYPTRMMKQQPMQGNTKPPSPYRHFYN